MQQSQPFLKRHLTAAHAPSVQAHTPEITDTLKRNNETAADRLKISSKQINNNNNNNGKNDMPERTKDKLYSVVGYGSNKRFLTMRHVRLKHVARTINVQ
jgi:hypothetical protein